MILGRSALEGFNINAQESFIQKQLSYDLYKNFKKQSVAKRSLRIAILSVEPDNYSNKKIIESFKCKKAIKAAKDLIKNKGRLLVRASGTEPKVRIMCESFSSTLIDKCISLVKKTIY